MIKVTISHFRKRAKKPANGIFSPEFLYEGIVLKFSLLFWSLLQSFQSLLAEIYTFFEEKGKFCPRDSISLWKEEFWRV